MNPRPKNFGSGIDRIQEGIHQFRGLRVLLDGDLAVLYGIPTKALLQAVKRHPDRFPADFMFRLTLREFNNLRSQIVTSSWGGRRHPPCVFTEQGVAMLSSVLNSPRAIRVNVEIMRAFVRMRRYALTYRELAGKIESLEKRYDGQFKVVFEALKGLMDPPPAGKRRIGFTADNV